MAGSSRILKEHEFRSAEAFQRALFNDDRGNPETAFQFLLREQREILSEEVETAMPGLPDKMDGQVGTQVLKDVPKARISKIIKSRMPFSTVARLFERGAGSIANKEDVLNFANRVLLMLKAASPSSRNSQYGTRDHIHYREGFRFLIGETAYAPGSVSVNMDFTVIGVTNVAPHAATMENPSWYRPFHRLWQRVSREATAKNLDSRFNYIRGGSLPMFREAYWENRGYKVGDTTPFKTYMQRSDYGHRRWIRYAVPVIWIGPLNSMGGKTGRIKSRPRRHRKRMDGRNP